MKRSYLKQFAVLAVIALFSCAPAFAAQNSKADKEKGKVLVKYDTVVAGQAVEQGTYDAVVTAGADPVLVLTHKSKEIARIPVEREALGASARYDRVDFRTDADGSKQIVTVIFKGSDHAFRVKGDSEVAATTNP